MCAVTDILHPSTIWYTICVSFPFASDRAHGYSAEYSTGPQLRLLYIRTNCVFAVDWTGVWLFHSLLVHSSLFFYCLYDWFPFITFTIPKARLKNWASHGCRQGVGNKRMIKWGGQKKIWLYVNPFISLLTFHFVSVWNICLLPYDFFFFRRHDELLARHELSSVLVFAVLSVKGSEKNKIKKKKERNSYSCSQLL